MIRIDNWLLYAQNESIDFVKHGIKTIVYPDNFNTAKI